jgi:hypothetical protein
MSENIQFNHPRRTALLIPFRFSLIHNPLIPDLPQAGQTPGMAVPHFGQVPFGVSLYSRIK